MNLTIDDEPVTSAVLPTQVRRIIEICEGLELGKGLSTPALVGRLGVCKQTVYANGAHPALQPYRHDPPQPGIVWVSAETKRALDEQAAGD